MKGIFRRTHEWIIVDRETIVQVLWITLGILACVGIGLMFLFLPIRNACMIVILIIGAIITFMEPFCGICILAFIYFVFLSNIKYIVGIGELRPIFYIACATLLFLIVKKVVEKNIKFTFSIQHLAIGILWFGMVISTIDAEISKSISWDKNFDFIKTILTYFLITILASTYFKFNLLFWIIAAGCSFLAAMGVRLYIGSGFNRRFFDQIGAGELADANDLACLLGMIVPFLYYKLFSQNKYEKIGALIFLPLVILCIIFTGSRGGALQLGLVIILIALRSKQRIKTFIMLFFIILLVISFAPQEYWYRMKTIKTYEQDTSAMGRIEIWKVAIKVWQDNPLTGVGQRNFILVCKKYFPETVRDTHNTYLQFLVEGGYVVFIPYLIVLFLAFRDIRIIKRSPVAKEQNFQIYNLALAIEIGLLGFLLYSFFGARCYFNVFYWFLGLIVALRNITRLSAVKKGEINISG